MIRPPLLNSSRAVATPYRLLAEQALSRAAGAPLLGGNSVELLIDAAAHYEAWLKSIRAARRRVLLENYIIRDDEVGREFRDALVERARAGIQVAVIVDWLGCLGQSRRTFWAALRAAGGQVRVFNPPQFGEPFGWISRDHRKLLVGDRARNVAPWRDTGVAVSGPAVAELEAAFQESWNAMGTPLQLSEVPES